MAKSVLGKVRVTAKQKSARRKNIAVARKAKKKGRRSSDKMGVENMPWKPPKRKRRRRSDKMGVENMPWV